MRQFRARILLHEVPGSADRILAELENDRERIQLRKAELTLGDKERLRERNARMLDEELISQQEFDDVESAWHLAKAERDLAAIALEETRIRAPFSGRITERRIVVGQQLSVASAAAIWGRCSTLIQPMSAFEIQTRFGYSSTGPTGYASWYFHQQSEITF